MKSFIKITFYSTLAILIFGLLFQILNWPGGKAFFALGLLGIFIYFISKLFKDYIRKRIDRYTILLQISIVLMCLILFSKYLEHEFGDYLGLFVLPFFIISTVLYLKNGSLKNQRLTSTSIIFFLLCIPLFGFNIGIEPQQYLPKEWYDRYGIEEKVTVKLPYSFKYKSTEKMSNEACSFVKSKDYYSAILTFEKALKIEPENPMLLLEISSCYANVNKLEKAIDYLNVAINIDSTYEGLYNNRGLLYHKLNDDDKAIKDFESAIKINPNQSFLYANLAISLYQSNKYSEACLAIQKAKQLGFKIDESKTIRNINKEICK
ncbi:tetratricopeptide repeat protein [Flavobacterium filum]|uniref:tetratricopeptide repeat protein n=2 Tax=Flavobacterium filum TaxID=370974 RepID=UPI00047C1126|nr:tetratricopeptide repeat protein [Flavobacterium filum]